VSEAPAATTTTARRKRPFGVGVIAVLMFLNAVTSVLTLYFNDTPSMQQLSEADYLELVGLGFALSGLAISIGLWLLQRWAWVAMMAVLGIDMAIDLYNYVYYSPAYASMVLSVIAVFYMNQHEVRLAFGYLPLGNRTDLE
jgi:hypothetical protein